MYYDFIAEKLETPEFLPRFLYDRFNIEVLATKDSPLDSLENHQTIRDSGWKARVVPALMPDCVVDHSFDGFRPPHGTMWPGGFDCAFLPRLVAEHQLDEDKAFTLAYELTNGLVRRAYKL